jgi:phosphoserine phosphatase RsbU/P
VDDVPKNIQVLGNILRQEGYSIDFATSGKQALTMAQTDLYDLILLDVMMPDMDGFEVCRRLQELPEGKGIPVIFLTAKTEGDDILKGFQMGALDYVTKPFNSPELIARVHTHLELKKARDKILQTSREHADRNDELSRLNQELQTALREINTLHGILPICSCCKKIRKEGASPSSQDSWVVLEDYIHAHTEAQFTHSICPECTGNLYPQIQQKKQ